MKQHIIRIITLFFIGIGSISQLMAANNAGFFFEGIGGYGQNNDLLQLNNDSLLKATQDSKITRQSHDKINISNARTMWQLNLSGGYRFVSAPFVASISMGSTLPMNQNQHHSSLGHQFSLLNGATNLTSSSSGITPISTPDSVNPLQIETLATPQTTKVGDQTTDTLTLSLKTPAVAAGTTNPDPTTISSNGSSLVISASRPISAALDFSVITDSTNNYTDTGATRDVMKDLTFNKNSSLWFNVEFAYALSQRMSIGGMLGTEYLTGDLSYQYQSSFQLKRGVFNQSDSQENQKILKYHNLRLGTIVEYNLGKRLSLVERFTYTTGLDKLKPSIIDTSIYTSTTERKINQTGASADIGLRWYVFS